MTILKIEVCHKHKTPLSRHVAYMPKYVAECLPKDRPINLISIGDTELSDFYYGPKTNFHYVYCNVWLGIIDTDLENIFKFVEQCNGENVYVHCEMGVRRSPWVAKHIMKRFGYILMRSFELEDGSIHEVERYQTHCQGF